MKRWLGIGAATVLLAACGSSSSSLSTDSGGTTHWSDADAQEFMSICDKSGVGINYDCLCLQTTMQADGKSPDDNPGKSLSGDELASCKN